MKTIDKAYNNAVLNTLNKTSAGKTVLKNPRKVQEGIDFGSGYITPPAPPKNIWEGLGMYINKKYDEAQVKK